MFLITLSACHAEDDYPTINKEDCYQLHFALSIVPPQTRALSQEPGTDPLNENKITAMDAFFYDGDVQKGHFSMQKGDLVVTLPNPSTATGTATIYVPKDTPISDSYTGHNYNLYVLVNYHGNENLEGRPLNELKQVIMTSESLVQMPDVKPQNDFLMDGTMKTGVMAWNTSNNNNYDITAVTGQTLKLARAAAKIRIRLDAKIVVKNKDEIYDVVGAPTIALKSYTNQTSLFAGQPVAAPTFLMMNEDDSQDMILADYNGKQFYAREVPFYSYENDWGNNASLRTYAVIKLHVRSQSSGKDSYSYYSVPLNYLTAKDGMNAEEIAGITKLQRNHLYDIECSIDELGSAEPTKPVTLSYGYIAVEDWNNPDAIDAAITKAHYLVVKETHPEMLNVNERLVEYISDLPIDVQKMNASIKYSYTQYELNGTQTTQSGTNKYGAIRVDTVYQNGKKYLKITSPVPDNYVPLTITFTVTQKQDADGSVPLSKDVVVTQYPPIYVTSKQSVGNREVYWYSAFTSLNRDNPTGRGGYQSNATLFTITTLAPVDGQIVGDPTTDGEHTGRDEESNKIVSPQFIIASQWGMSTAVPQYGSSSTRGWHSSEAFNLRAETGITDRYAPYRYYDYNNAEERAYNYWEDDYGISVTDKLIQGDGFTRNSTMRWSHTFKYEGRWRIPTLAELALIVKIQSDPNSAVKSLLWGYQYWSAQTDWAYRFADRSYRNPRWPYNYVSLPVGPYENTENISIRPVFDTYNKSE